MMSLQFTQSKINLLNLCYASQRLSRPVSFKSKLICSIFFLILPNYGRFTVIIFRNRIVIHWDWRPLSSLLPSRLHLDKQVSEPAEVEVRLIVTWWWSMWQATLSSWLWRMTLFIFLWNPFSDCCLTLLIWHCITQKLHRRACELGENVFTGLIGGSTFLKYNF